VEKFDVNEQSIQELLYLDTDFYFNISEGIGNLPKSFADVADKLETIDVPFSGSSASALRLTTDKPKVKELLARKGIATANFCLFSDNFENLSHLKFPLIVKPSNEDCSIGISEQSVVYKQNHLMQQVKILQEKYTDPLLVEEYLQGREFAVTVVGNGKKAKVLPIYEIKYGDYFANRPHIYDYQAKWDEKSKQYEDISVQCPADIDDQLQEKIIDTALTAYHATRCSDYARVDMRLSSTGEPNVLEINANPGIGPNDETVSSARSLGISYEEFLDTIVHFSLRRFYSDSYEKYLPLYTSA